MTKQGEAGITMRVVIIKMASKTGMSYWQCMATNNTPRTDVWHELKDLRHRRINHDKHDLSGTVEIQQMLVDTSETHLKYIIVFYDQ